MRPRRVVTWSRVGQAIQSLAAHCALFAFTVLLVSKINSQNRLSWWWIFSPLWVFHGISARGRFSLPAPSAPHDRHWAPCHAVVAVPLIVAFEVLLCTYLVYKDRGESALTLKVVFSPLLIFEVVTLVDNFRMCRALMPGDEDSMTDDAIWETLPHFWIAVSMVFFIAATTFTLLKLSGNVHALGWWDLFINFGIAECFAFLVCTKWSNPSIPRDRFQLGTDVARLASGESGQPSTSGGDIDDNDEGFCGLENLGGHLIKISILIFQVLLCMKLEGTPKQAKRFPLFAVFLPVLLVQGVAVVSSLLKVLEKFLLLLRTTDMNNNGGLLPWLSKAQELCGFLDHGSRLLGWWSIDERSHEEHACLWAGDASGYSTFTNLPPEVVKKMPRKDLTEEVWKLQAALEEQAEINKCQQDEYTRLQNDKVLCRLCFEREIAVVLLPCRHRVVCNQCSEKCKNCPVCRGNIKQRMTVFDV